MRPFLMGGGGVVERGGSGGVDGGGGEGGSVGRGGSGVGRGQYVVHCPELTTSVVLGGSSSSGTQSGHRTMHSGATSALGSV